MTTPDGKQYRILPSDEGKEIREYASGVIYDYTNKKPVRGLPLTPEIARSMQGRKHELAIEAASAGMLAAVESLSPDFVPGSGELGAWAVVVGKQTELALSPDAGHASTKAAEFIGRAADLLPDRRSAAQSLPDGVAMQLNLTDDAAAMLAQAFAQRSTLQAGQGQGGERAKQYTDGGEGA